MLVGKLLISYFVMLRPPLSTLFPYTTLFRSVGLVAVRLGGDDASEHAECIRHAHLDRKSTRLNSSHVAISYAVFCLKKKNAFKIQCGLLERVVNWMRLVLC